MKTQKRAVAIHDISCVGKCSLTVALPILSAGGIECAVLPTAILSTHTGDFKGYTYRDLTDDINPIKKHWQAENLKFDAIYTGFLGSYEQLNIISDFIDDFKNPDNIVFVDPAMADDGKLYTTFDEKYAKKMRNLCAKADIIVPNMTEAALLLDKPYMQPPYNKEYIEDILISLSKIGPKKVILTGVAFEESSMGVAYYENGKTDYCLSSKIKGFFYGTGDIFASALLTGIMNNLPLSKAISIAVNFTADAIKRTVDAGTDVRFGVDFEQGIAKLCKDLEK